MTVWGFPKSWGCPQVSSIYRWIFHELNHLAIGVPPWIGNPHMFDCVLPIPIATLPSLIIPTALRLAGWLTCPLKPQDAKEVGSGRAADDLATEHI